MGHALAGDRLTFDPSLPREVFRDLEGARWAKDANGRALPSFDKEALDPHAGEALVYAVTALESVLDLHSDALRRGRVF